MSQQPIVPSQPSTDEQNIQHVAGKKTAPAHDMGSCPSGCCEDVPDWMRYEERGEDFQFDPRRK